MAEPGDNPNDGIRRPYEYAIISQGPEVASFVLDAEVRLDAPVSVNNRDVILVFGFQSDTEYYYAHLSQDNTIYAHNGIFKVNGVDRERIDDQWDGALGAPPSITDDAWHQVRLIHCAETGEIAVQLDGLERPLLTATDDTFSSGRVGFGSFDNTGRIRAVTLTGDPVQPPAQVLPSVEITGGGGTVGSNGQITVTGVAQPGSTGWRDGKAEVYAELLNSGNAKVVGRAVPVTEGAFSTIFGASGVPPGDYTIKVSVRAAGHPNASDTEQVTIVQNDQVDLAVSVRSQCWAEQAVVAVHVVNRDGHAADIRATTPFGEKKWTSVPDDAAVYQGFQSGTPSIQAGSVRVAGYTFHDGVGHYQVRNVPYQAVNCG